MKNIIIFTLVLLTSLFAVQGADFYNFYNVDFTDERPTSVYVEGDECLNSICSAKTARTVTVYQGTQAKACIDQVFIDENVNSFNNCMNNAQISSNGIAALGTDELIVTKVSVPSTHGYLTYFSANDDEYIPYFFRSTTFSCTFDICVDSLQIPVDFEKKANPIAEIQQFNVLNTQNALLPLQIDVPVSLDANVCSAYQLAQPQFFQPTFPAGYSNHKALTDVNLTISNLNSGVIYNTQSQKLNIDADTCTGIATFSWLPPSSLNLVNEEVKFRIDTLVVDDQTFDPIPDFAEVVETIYPQNITNTTCFVTTTDFTLSNEPILTTTPSLTEIEVGERLYAIFTAGAFRDNPVEPIDFDAQIEFNGAQVYAETLNSGATPQTYVVNLSHLTTTPGTFPVKLTNSPNAPNCDVTSDDIQTLNLVITPEPLVTVDFIVRDNSSNFLNGVKIEFEEQSTPTRFDETQFTDVNGETQFTDVPLGTYTYTAMLDGFQTLMNSVIIGSNTTILITLIPVENNTNNTNGDPIIIDFDANPMVGFEPLDTLFSVEVADPENDTLICTLAFGDNTTAPTTDCDALDGLGHTYVNAGNYTAVLTVSDGINTPVIRTKLIEVLKNTTIGGGNNPPTAIFFGDPTVGLEDLNVAFTVSAADPDNDPLTCTLEFGDNTTAPTNNCAALNGITHLYTTPGNYTAILTVDDGTDSIQLFEFIEVLKERNTTVGNLSSLGPMLIIDEVIIKGPFDFQIKTQNESAHRRIIEARPIISCFDETNRLRMPPSGKLTHSAVSSVDGKVTIFNFELDTADFELNVPTDVLCKFTVELTDSYGGVVVLSDYVTFIYPEAEKRISSIRGQGTDVINYMHTALGGIERGYQTIDFSIDNREGVSKEMEISIMSRSLGIQYTAVEKLDANEVRPISIPLYIRPSTQSGMYDMRVSVLDDEDKQVRYSYIKLD